LLFITRKEALIKNYVLKNMFSNCDNLKKYIHGNQTFIYMGLTIIAN